MNALNRNRAILLCVLFLACSSCATLLKGTTDQIMVSTDPAGAKVSINNQQSGETPFVTTVPSSQNLHIHLRKAGYYDQDMEDDATFRWGWETWAFLAYIIPCVVDLSSGAAWGHQQTMLVAHLEPMPQGGPAALTVPPGAPAQAPALAPAPSPSKTPAPST
jgi:PEGA domain